MGMGLTRAVEEAGLGEDDEGAGVARQDAAEEDVAQLPARSHDDGGPVKKRMGKSSKASKVDLARGLKITVSFILTDPQTTKKCCKTLEGKL